MATRLMEELVVKQLINAGSDIMSCDESKWTVLHRAAFNGWGKVVQLLVNKNMNLNMKDIDGFTPLMLAAYNSHQDVAELLINSSADIHCCNNMKMTVLHFAAANGIVELVQYLWKKGAILDVIDDHDKTPLMLAVEYSHKEVVELLIKFGANTVCFPHERRRLTVLQYAILLGKVNIVQYLLNIGFPMISTDYKNKTPLMLALDNLHEEVAELLINFNGDIQGCDDDGLTSLHYASRHGYIKIVKLLLNKGSDINARASNGCTPLSLAVKLDHTELVTYLLKEGADCNLKDQFSQSPFNILTMEEQPKVEIIKLCIDKGAFVNCTDYYHLRENPLLQTAVLKDINVCYQAILNKFNNKDLPEIYSNFTYAQRLPPCDKLKIGHNSGMALEVKKAVIHAIKAKGFCNLLEIVPLSLSFLAMKSMENYQAFHTLNL